MIGRNDDCWCGSKNKWKKCHFPQISPNPEMMSPSKESLAQDYLRKYEILIKTPEQIEGIRASGRLASRLLDEICSIAKEGVTTQALDDLAVRLHKEAGAIAAPLRYGSPPFPKSICTSLNEVICHGIPNNIPLKEGDILNVDVTCILDSYYGDCSRMVTIGKVDPVKQLVTDVSYECLMKAISVLKPGVPLCAIGDAIENHAMSKGCSVVNQFVGHGVGIEFHEAPHIPHHKNYSKIALVPGMIFTIEPMINAGVKTAVIDPYDHWTARTKDGKPSAQWEHTILITEKGYELLTNWIR